MATNIFFCHPPKPGAPVLCDLGVEVKRAFETAGEVYATEAPWGEAAAAVKRGPYSRLDEASKAIDQWMATARTRASGRPLDVGRNGVRGSWADKFWEVGLDQ